MTKRPLDADEAALWARVLATVRPLPGRKAPDVTPIAASPVRTAIPPRPAPKKPAAKARPLGVTLDASWDRKLTRGVAEPDCTIDLHGHSLATAYARLDSALEQAIAEGDRVVLLITGKPPRAESERPHARGAIRDAIGDWLAASRHASSIGAVRNAHPRHGGAGALYIVLRRNRAPRT